jgi:hypothetical protein
MIVTSVMIDTAPTMIGPAEAQVLMEVARVGVPERARAFGFELATRELRRSVRMASP